MREMGQAAFCSAALLLTWGDAPVLGPLPSRSPLLWGELVTSRACFTEERAEPEQAVAQGCPLE